MKLFSKEKISWMLRRHPLLYYFRFAFISENLKEQSTDNLGCFNDLNQIEDVPELYFKTNVKINLSAESDEFEKAKKIAGWIRTNIKGGKGLGLSSEMALEKMLTGQGGVCSDFSQIYNNFCLINNILVKEWSCVDRFYETRYGHTYNEIYSSTLRKWIAIDTSLGVYFYSDNPEIPLSVLELFTYLREGNQLHYVFFSDYIHPNIQRLKAIYSKSAIPFLTINYKNHDNDYVLNKFHGIPSFLINAVLLLKRKHFHFVFVLDNYKVKLLPRYFQNLISTESSHLPL